MTDPRELLQAFLDDELSAPERKQVAAALAADPALRAELARLQAVGELVRAGASPEMPEQMMSMIRDRVSETKRPWFERLFPSRVPYLSLGFASTAVLCVLLAPLTRMPEVGSRSRDVYVTVNDSMTTQADGAAAYREKARPETDALFNLAAPEKAGKPARAMSAAEPADASVELGAAVESESARPAMPATGVAGGVVRDGLDLNQYRDGRAGIEYEESRPSQPAPPPVEALPRLQAGEIDDNLLFGKYVQYADTKQFPAQGVTAFPVRERYVIQVVDRSGVGVADTGVEVFEQEAPGRRLVQARTDASGQAVFFPGRYATSSQGFTAFVRPGADRRDMEMGSPTSFFRGKPSRPWRLTVGPPKVAAFAGETVDVAFLVDTTGSMSEEISRLRETIDQVTMLLDNTAQRPKLRFGMVLYRDLGDEYVTKEFAFTGNVAAFSKSLVNVRADGGGDTPEHVNAALAAAVSKLKWSDAPALRLAFLIGDAPPQLGYATDEQNPPYLASVDQAREKGIKFFTISTSGNDDVGEYVWRQIALLTRGKFLFITKGDALGDVPARPAQPDDGSTPHHVERQDYTVQALPNLIEQCVRRELAALGTKPPSTIDVDLPPAPQVEPPAPPAPPAPPVVFEPVKKLSFAAFLLIVMANLAGWVWAWRKSRRMSLRRG